MAANDFDIVRKKLNFIFLYLKKEMIRELELQGHKASGDLISSIDAEIEEGTDYIQLDGTFNFYGKFVDSGRSKGVKRVPIDSLIEWIKIKNFQAPGDERKRKSFTEDKWRKSLAFAIQSSIYKKGISTPQSWKGEKTKGWMTNVLTRNSDRIEKDLAEVVKDALQLTIFNVLKEIELKSPLIKVN